MNISHRSRINSAIGAALTLLTLSGASHAGSAAQGGVDIQETAQFGADFVASGAMSLVRNSKNDSELIGCSIRGVSLEVAQGLFGREEQLDGFCQAVDPSGLLRLGCTTTDPALLETIATVNESSRIAFWSAGTTTTVLDGGFESINGECVGVRVSNQSIYLPEAKTAK